MEQHSTLAVLDPTKSHEFLSPLKKIHDGPDVSFFLTSLAYKDIMTFILQLNHAMVPRICEGDATQKIQAWELDSKAVTMTEPAQKLQQLVGLFDSLIDDVPPDTGPRRFGNISFRKWYDLVEERVPGLLKEIVPCDIVSSDQSKIDADGTTALNEIQIYLLGSFGSSQRLDYGSGHELSFMAFLGGLWKLGIFEGHGPGVAERAIVTGVFEPYLNLVRRLIKSYTLEPAGSHGVWGLDDNSFLPYIFGSAQLAPAIQESDSTPVEGSLPEAPDASSVTNRSVMQRERTKNMYFSAIGFIFDVKRGPFGEHSPMLYDISGITAGWGKINKGMIKMYNAEVLSKFPVVQHFPFGSLFRWEKDPDAVEAPPTAHTTTQPLREPTTSNIKTPRPMPLHGAGPPGLQASSGPSTSAPWAVPPSKPPVGMVDGVTRAPWASATKSPPPPNKRNRPGPGR